MTTQSALPLLYADWIQELVGGTISGEPLATCDDCAMCTKEASAPGETFRPNVKCCSYLPNVPNYQVGRILADPARTAEVGRASMRARVEARLAVTPLGVDRPRSYDVLYPHATFGRSMAMRCPHYIDEGSGLCGIWKHRDAVCSTWFCKHERGAVGFDFWHAVQALLSAVERSLARYCVAELDIGERALDILLASERTTRTGEPIDDSINESQYREVWGNWHGREEAFFVACGEKVSSLSWGEVKALGGSDLRLHAAQVRNHHARRQSSELPERLKVSDLKLTWLPNGMRRITTYSGYDPIDVPDTVVDLLAYFDGRKTARAIADIAEDHNLQIDNSLVRKLVDFAVLGPTEEP